MFFVQLLFVPYFPLFFLFIFVQEAEHILGNVVKTLRKHTNTACSCIRNRVIISHPGGNMGNAVQKGTGEWHLVSNGGFVGYFVSLAIAKSLV